MDYAYISAITDSTGSSHPLKDQFAREAAEKKIWLEDHVQGFSGHPESLSVLKVTGTEYGQMVTTSSLCPSAVYIVDEDDLDMYGQRIINLAAPSGLSDAVNKLYVDSAVSALSAGSVKSSSLPNRISVLDDHEMEINVVTDQKLSSLDADKLFQKPGDVLVLHGGNA